jgi:hypothetical protein
MMEVVNTSETSAYFNDTTQYTIPKAVISKLAAKKT